jgi:hypothetical protein
MKPARLLPRLLLSITAVAFSAFLTQGCKATAESVCERACDCEDCDEDGLADCVDDFEDLKEDAIDEGCDNDFQDLLDCLDTRLECDEDQTSLENCEDEVEELADCLEEPVLGVSGSGDPPDGDPDPDPSDGPCDQMKACCVAAAQQAMTSSSSCSLYDDVPESQCQQAIDAYTPVPNAPIPTECKFL